MAASQEKKNSSPQPAKISWGVEGYEVPRKYASFSKDIKVRTQSAPKRDKKGRLILPDKGYYLENHLKEQGSFPSSAQYNHVKKWALSDKELEDSGQKKRQLNYHTDRKTFFDHINQNAQRNPSPASNAYKVVKGDFHKRQSSQERYAQEMINEKDSKREKQSYLNEIQYQAATTPGPGEYNPHVNITTVNVDRRDMEYWKEKHKQVPNSKKRSTSPGVGIYNHFPANCETFGKMQIKQDQKMKENMNSDHKQKCCPIQKKGEKFIHYGFGVSTRNLDTVDKKNRSYSPGPGPGSYRLEINWRERPGSPSKQNPYNRISKGIEKSIYYGSSESP